MRKALAVLFIVFALAFLLGATIPTAQAVPCYYKCICSFPHKCCIVNGVEVCKRVIYAPIECPQDFPC